MSFRFRNRYLDVPSSYRFRYHYRYLPSDDLRSRPLRLFKAVVRFVVLLVLMSIAMGALVAQFLWAWQHLPLNG